MRNLIKLKILLLPIIFTLVSCEEFIDLHPLDKIGTDNYWKTSQDLKNYVIRFYPSLNKDGRGDTDDLIEEGLISPILNGERVESTGTWRNYWVNIRDINYFFDNYQKCEDEFSNYSQYVGEAHFFKAWYYFRLLKRFGDVPWYSTVIELDDDDLLFQPRDPRNVVVDSIIANLDKAILYLGARTAVGNILLSKEAALTFKTRVALYEGTWQKYHANTPFGTSGANPNKYFQECVNAAEELINGDYKVGIYNTGNPDNDYFELFGFDDMGGVDEVILYKAYNQNQGIRNAVQAETTYKSVGRGYTWGLVSTYLGKNGEPYDFLGLGQEYKGNEFLAKIAEDCDPRLKSTIWIPGDLMSAQIDKYFSIPEISGTGSFLCPTGFQVKKHANPYSKGAGFDWDVGSETGAIIFRYGEVLLNYAEAKYELDGVVAYEQLNKLRERVGMPNFVVNKQNLDLNPHDYGYSISDELYEIRRERRVETVDEGLRYDDLMRWAAHSLFKNKRPKGYPYDPEEYPGYPEDQVDENGLIDYFVNRLPQGYQFREGQDYLFSIPQDDLTLNPNLEQNPGW